MRWISEMTAAYAMRFGRTYFVSKSADSFPPNCTLAETFFSLLARILAEAISVLSCSLRPANSRRVPPGGAKYKKSAIKLRTPRSPAATCNQRRASEGATPPLPGKNGLKFLGISNGDPEFEKRIVLSRRLLAEHLCRAKQRGLL